MKSLEIKSSITVFEEGKEMNKKSNELLRSAKENLKHAYAPYSNFKVSAAIRLSNGKTIVGHNFENASYPLCLCAERVALASATSQYPDERIESMAITILNPNQHISQPVSPCGACRQVILEVEQKQGKPIELILQGESGPIYVVPSGKTLLPLYFDGSFLNP